MPSMCLFLSSILFHLDLSACQVKIEQRGNEETVKLETQFRSLSMQLSPLFTPILSPAFSVIKKAEKQKNKTRRNTDSLRGRR